MAPEGSQPWRARSRCPAHPAPGSCEAVPTTGAAAPAASASVLREIRVQTRSRAPGREPLHLYDLARRENGRDDGIGKVQECLNHIDRTGQAFPAEGAAGFLAILADAIDREAVTRGQEAVTRRGLLVQAQKIGAVDCADFAALGAHQMLPHRRLTEQVLITLEALTEIVLRN